MNVFFACGFGFYRRATRAVAVSRFLHERAIKSGGHRIALRLIFPAASAFAMTAEFDLAIPG